ncbi:MAG: hypothetical protein LBC04_03040, partial [Holosporaceae bacterium]|nr:hypothetical protein [Holosporaceae bacterium]
MEEDKRNIVMFFIISILIMVGYQYFLENSRMPEPTVMQSPEEKSIASEAPPTPENETPTKPIKIQEICIESRSFSGKISSR